MWATRVQPPVCVHSRRPWRGCPPLSTGNPPAVHGSRPRAWGQRRPAAGPSSPEPSTAHPHSSTGGGREYHCRYLSTSISPGLVHICAEQRRCLSTVGDNALGTAGGQRWHAQFGVTDLLPDGAAGRGVGLSHAFWAAPWRRRAGTRWAAQQLIELRSRGVSSRSASEAEDAVVETYLRAWAIGAPLTRTDR
jgi:hypothetical protein